MNSWLIDEAVQFYTELRGKDEVDNLLIVRYPSEKEIYVLFDLTTGKVWSFPSHPPQEEFDLWYCKFMTAIKKFLSECPKKNERMLGYDYTIWRYHD